MSEGCGRHGESDQLVPEAGGCFRELVSCFACVFRLLVLIVLGFLLVIGRGSEYRPAGLPGCLGGLCVASVFLILSSAARASVSASCFVVR